MAAVSAEGLSAEGGWGPLREEGLCVCDPAKARGTLTFTCPASR